MKHWKQITFICILAIIVTACASPKKEEGFNAGTGQPEPSVSNNNETLAEVILEIYRKILHNEASFVYENSEDTYLLSFYRRDNREDSFNHFAVLDMDGDGMPELVLHNMYNGDFLVLHYYNGAVYGQKYGYRAMKNLKMDGFFGWSNSASNSGLGKLRFSGSEQETMDLAEYGSLLEDIEMYRINGNPVSQKDYLAYTAIQNAKEDVVWHERNAEATQRSPLQYR
jgi:hypothetical protein